MADACVEKVLEAVGAEQQAIALDRRNETQAAVDQYEAAARLLADATSLAESGAHAQDAASLRRHGEELAARMEHLRSLAPGQEPSIRLEDQVHTVELAMTAPQSQSTAAGLSSGPPQVPTVAGAAAVGAVGGVVLGSVLCAPLLGAVAGAAGMGLVAGREGPVGDAARNAGSFAATATSTVAGKAQELGAAAGAAAGDVTSKGRASRSAAPEENGYKFGDFTRGLVAEGKETRGASATDGYRFGDFSRGVMAKLTGR